MALSFDGNNVVAVGGATKKSEYDQVLENTQVNKDVILGDNGEGSGASGHAHTGTGSNDGELIAQGALKTTTEEVSVTNANTNVTLSNVGSYGFYPQIKSDSAGRNMTVQIANAYSSLTSYATIVFISIVVDTGFAQFRYVQASRDEPVLWLLREKVTGLQLASSYQPECGGETHPFNDINGEPLNDTHEILCLQLNDNILLRRHLEENAKQYGYLWQLHLGLYTGQIKITGNANPRLDSEEAPCLFDIRAGLKSFTWEVDNG